MLTNLIDSVDGWAVFLIHFAIIFLAAEVGVRVGVWRQARSSGKERIHTGPAVTAALSLLALMLALVFSAVESRFNERKHLALDEASAIGTTITRAELLPVPHRGAAIDLLREYVVLRSSGTESLSKENFADFVSRSKELHNALLAEAYQVAEKAPTPMTSLFIQSLNETIDLHGKRLVVGIHYRIPITVWLSLYALAIVAMALAGYDSGVSGNRRISGVRFAAALAFAIVLSLVVLLDRPYPEFSSVTQSAILDLARDMEQLSQ